MGLIKSLFTIILVLVLCACSKPQTISKEEAESLAAAKLEEYVKEKSLSLSQFGKPVIRYTDKDVAGKDFNVWEVYYASKDKPIHRVNILVDQYGRIELHQMIDKE